MAREGGGGQVVRFEGLPTAPAQARAGGRIRFEDGRSEGRQVLTARASQQRDLLQAAKESTGEAFQDATKNWRGVVTKADLQEFKAAIVAHYPVVSERQKLAMTTGWMNVLAGHTAAAPGTKDSPLDGDIEEIAQKGVLRIVFMGENDRPTQIVTAKVDGLNASMRAHLSEQRLGDLLDGTHGRQLDILFSTFPRTPRTGMPFRVSASTLGKATQAEVLEREPKSPLDKGAIYFSVFLDRAGGTPRIDEDWGGWLSPDRAGGADAGRWFLKEIKSPKVVLNELGALKLPKVTG